MRWSMAAPLPLLTIMSSLAVGVSGMSCSRICGLRRMGLDALVLPPQIAENVSSDPRPRCDSWSSSASSQLPDIHDESRISMSSTVLQSCDPASRVRASQQTSHIASRRRVLAVPLLVGTPALSACLGTISRASTRAAAWCASRSALLALVPPLPVAAVEAGLFDAQLSLALLVTFRMDVEKADTQLVAGDTSETRGRIKKLLRQMPRRLASDAAAAAGLSRRASDKVKDSVREATEYLAGVVEFDALDDINNPTSSRLANLTPEKAAFAHHSLAAAMHAIDDAIAVFDPSVVDGARMLARRSAAS